MKIPPTFPPTEPAIEIVNGNPLTTKARECKADVVTFGGKKPEGT